MMTHRRPLTLFLALLFLLSQPNAGVSQDAASTPDAESYSAPVQIGIWPEGAADGTRFEAEIPAGGSAELVAVIGSFGEEAIELRTFTSDVAPMVNGGLGVRDRDAEQHEPTTWMSYPTEEFTVQPGQLIEKPFTVNVPEGAAPGQYVNALVLETVNAIDEGDSSAFNKYYRKVVSVYITVPGELTPAFELGEPEIDIAGSEGAIFVPVQNTGNVRIDLAGKASLSSASGSVIVEVPVVMGPVYGGQLTVVRILVPQLPPEGEYLFSIDLADEEQGVSDSLGEVALHVPAAEETATGPAVFENVAIEPNADPIQFANVSLDITVSQNAFPSARLTLVVTRDGEPVEEFVLADNMALSPGTTSVQQRYLPITGWESGTYGFSLKLEDTSTGGQSLIVAEEGVAEIEVP